MRNACLVAQLSRTIAPTRSLASIARLFLALHTFVAARPGKQRHRPLGFPHWPSSNTTQCVPLATSRSSCSTLTTPHQDAARRPIWSALRSCFNLRFHQEHQTHRDWSILASSTSPPLSSKQTGAAGWRGMSSVAFLPCATLPRASRPSGEVCVVCGVRLSSDLCTECRRSAPAGEVAAVSRHSLTCGDVG